MRLIFIYWQQTKIDHTIKINTIKMFPLTNYKPSVIILAVFAIKLWSACISLPVVSGASNNDNSTSTATPNNSINLIQSNSDPPTTPRQLAQSAPYAIPSNNNNDGMKNILLRALNATTANNQTNQPFKNSDNNGTIVHTQSNFNLVKLLDTLNNNNYTSEVSFNDDDEPSTVNITISNFRNAEPSDEMFLDELLIDARDTKNQTFSGSVMRDNHRYKPKHPTRSKPSSIETTVLGITAPPISSAIEVMAENYTMRKIADEANVFAIKLLHQQNIEKLGSHNLVQSPFAVYQGLALLLCGAMGDTAKELDKVLLGTQSSYVNTKLTHDQDRSRLMASLSEVIFQLQRASTNHYYPTDLNATTSGPYSGGSAEQHLIVANNLLFSSSANEISNDFRTILNTYFNNTAITNIETGSTESVRTINNWIRRTTLGLVPSILDKRATFDEFNVMSMLSTSWLSQDWMDRFYRVTSPTRTTIRLKAQGKALSRQSRDPTLLEFVDDSKRSHFVDYIQSSPSKDIQHYHMLINNVMTDVVVVPFQDSNHCFIALTPSVNGPLNTTLQSIDSNNPSSASNQLQVQANELDGASNGNQSATIDAPDSSPLSTFIAALVGHPKRAMRSLWNVIAPEIVTKQTLKNIHLARQKNITLDEKPSTIPSVQLSIPIFKTQADSSISAALNQIGIVNSFDPNQANFIGINGHPFNYFKLHLSNVLSKTTLNLDDRGLNYDRTIKTLESLRIHKERSKQKLDKEADLDTYNGMNFIDEVNLNKPFVFLICDLKTRLILYTGALRNPAQDVP